jgi:uncharacterized oligopeptide transporter (OPT) family protein
MRPQHPPQVKTAPQPHRAATAAPRAFELRTLPVYVLLAGLSAAVCAQINVRLGITPNTAVIGALVAIAVGRTILPAFRTVERQVMVETATSAGGFAGANIGLVSFAVLFVLGLEHLFWPLAIGLAVGMAADIWLGYRLFGSGAFPAAAPWPDGEAVGRVIEAGDKGGRLARQLGEGIVAALLGSIIHLPMAGLGLAFIGNPIALAALAFGLLVRGYSGVLHYDFARSYLPHGMMIGAGLVQVIQTGWLFWQSRRNARTDPKTVEGDGSLQRLSTGDLAVHSVVLLGGALLLLVAGRLWSYGASPMKLIAWVGYAGIAALVHTIVVGYCAMLSGWFPSFAVAIALMMVAVLLGFPPELLAVLAGYVLSTGPQFADLGYDLKSGWIVRGRGRDVARELDGRRQQAWLQELGALVGLAVAAMAFRAYWKLGLVPPMSRVMAATISVTVDPHLSSQLFVGALIGMAVQALGSAKRALGIMLATGLLLNNVAYGFALASGLILRRWIPASVMSVRAPGLIAGDGIAGFVAAIIRSM